MTQKLDETKRLTGELAHDLNNMLAGVTGALQLLNRRLEKGQVEKVTYYADVASSAAYRASVLVRRLLDMRKEEGEHAMPLSVATVVSEFRKIIFSVANEKARISFELDDNLWPILATREQIENALLNLVINARDAIDVNGDIRIATRNRRREVGKVSAGGSPAPRDYVVLSVADTGCGMTPDVIDKIFEPFFSTKAKERGTGLGLATVARFVHSQGGHIVVESRVGYGTDVQLWLPRHRPARGRSCTTS